MLLLELYLTPLEAHAHTFRTIVSQFSGASDGYTDACLPFWLAGHDWRVTMIKTLESTQFSPQVFPEPGEQDWMVGAGLLSPDRRSFHPDYLETIGQALYQALFPPGSSVYNCLQLGLRMADQENTGLHLRLKFPADVALRSRLADYPWELLHDGQRFLQHRQVYLSRYIAYEAVPPRLPAATQIQVLLVSSRAVDATQGLAMLPDTEPQALQAGLAKAAAEGLITMTSLPTPTYKGLSRYLTDADRPPAVIHFDGHGLYGKRCLSCQRVHAGIKRNHCQGCGHLLPEAQGFLLFEDDQGNPDYVSAKSLAALLPSGVALVVLSACQSGMAVAGESVFNGAAQQLIDARVPAVVAMQYAVQVKAASEFVEQFYRVLGRRRSLLEAVNAGRRSMGVEGNQWYRPVLYLRWQDNDGGQLVSDATLAGAKGGANQPKLTRFQRLERDRWQTELADLDQDYQSLKARLRVEQDGPTRNRLERHIEQIGQAMDTKEQQLMQLEQLEQLEQGQPPDE